MTPSTTLAILRHLAARTHASAAAIGISFRMTAAEVRARLVMLESMHQRQNATVDVTAKPEV